MMEFERIGQIWQHSFYMTRFSFVLWRVICYGFSTLYFAGPATTKRTKPRTPQTSSTHKYHVILQIITNGFKSNSGSVDAVRTWTGMWFVFFPFNLTHTIWEKSKSFFMLQEIKLWWLPVWALINSFQAV